MFTKALAAVPLFSDLSEEQLARVASRLKRQAFEEHAVIVRQGSPGDALFILLSGRVKVSCSKDEGDGETIVAVLSTGDFFGELSVLDGEVRSANVVALEHSQALVLYSSDVYACIEEYPAIAMGLLKGLAGRVRHSTERIRALSSMDVYGRIAQQLLYLSSAHGAPMPDGTRLIRPRLTQHDIANLVGASRESVNKAMGFFKTKGYITVDGLGYIVVQDPEGLSKRCR